MKKPDIFSLGLSVYEIYTGDKLPVYKEPEDRKEVDYIDGKYKWDIYRSGKCPKPIDDPQINQLVEWMIEPDYTRRPSAEQLLKKIRSW